MTAPEMNTGRQQDEGRETGKDLPAIAASSMATQAQSTRLETPTTPGAQHKAGPKPTRFDRLSAWWDESDRHGISYLAATVLSMGATSVAAIATIPLSFSHPIMAYCSATATIVGLLTTSILGARVVLGGWR